MPQKPEISIIIPSFNGRKSIQSLLHYIELQEFTDFEVIVVIDGSTDGTDKALRSKKYPFKLTIVEQPNKGRAAARNSGVKEAKADILLFVDDDMRLEPDVLNRHIELQHKTPGGFIMGTAREDHKLAQTDFQNYRAYLSSIWEPKTSERQSEEEIFLMAAHVSVDKAIFLKLGSFDERLTDAEDFDLALKAHCQNVPIYFHNEIIGWHDDLVTCQSYIRRQRQYRIAQRKLAEINPLAKQSNNYEPNWPKGIKLLGYMIVSVPVFPWLIDNLNIFILLPQKLRYKLYSAIVHSKSSPFIS
jgi:glycosyltransferase involved in cell wall biosynthesis